MQSFEVGIGEDLNKSPIIKGKGIDADGCFVWNCWAKGSDNCVVPISEQVNDKVSKLFGHFDAV